MVNMLVLDMVISLFFELQAVFFSPSTSPSEGTTETQHCQNSVGLSVVVHILSSSTQEDPCEFESDPISKTKLWEICHECGLKRAQQ